MKSKSALLLISAALLLHLNFHAGAQARDKAHMSQAGAVYIVGNVAQPQGINFAPATTLTRALAMAGGVLPDTNKKRIVVFRLTNSGERVAININLKAILEERAVDFALKPYDIVCVPDKKSKSGGCSPGFVMSPNPRLPLRIIQ